jgi:hypothetical protein
MEAPFERPQAHGNVLRKALIEVYRAEQAELGAEPWIPPAVQAESDVAAFVACCESFRRRLAEVCVHLVIVLGPARITDPRAYGAWLGRLLGVPASANVRFLLLDHVNDPRFEELAKAEPKRVKTIVAGLDLPGALEDLAKSADHQETPGGRFRRIFVAMTGAAKKKEVDRVLVLGADAEKIADREDWHHLVVAVHFAAGAALLDAKRPLEAAEAYEKAELAAVKAERAGIPAGADLKISSRMARGAALVIAGAHGKAAAIYRDTAAMAKAKGDPRMELECWRMASHCHEASREPAPAWQTIVAAWKTGKAMDQQTRETSTLPFVVEAIKRLGRAQEHRRELAQIERELVEAAPRS